MCLAVIYYLVHISLGNLYIEWSYILFLIQVFNRLFGPANLGHPVFLVQTFDFVLLYIFNVGWDQGTLCSYAKLNIIQIYRVLTAQNLWWFVKFSCTVINFLVHNHSIVGKHSVCLYNKIEFLNSKMHLLKVPLFCVSYHSSSKPISNWIHSSK